METPRDGDDEVRKWTGGLSDVEKEEMIKILLRVTEGREMLSGTREFQEFLEIVKYDGTITESSINTNYDSLQVDGGIPITECVNFIDRHRRSQFTCSHLNHADIIHTFVAFGGNPDTTGCVDLSLINSILEDFELDFDLLGHLKPPNPDGEGEQTTMVDFNTFGAVFGRLLTQRHFSAPVFHDVY